MSAILITLSLVLIIILFICGDRKKSQQQIKTEMILSVLPQIQCGECGYPGCLPYAEAIVQNKADINQCGPGGTHTIRTLADLLGAQVKPFNVKHAADYDPQTSNKIASIDEALCIGCVKCILVCPTDAIIGANKQMHSIIAAECTGCELCLAPCPMDCISMQISPKMS